MSRLVSKKQSEIATRIPLDHIGGERSGLSKLSVCPTVHRMEEVDASGYIQRSYERPSVGQTVRQRSTGGTSSFRPYPSSDVTSPRNSEPETVPGGGRGAISIGRQGGFGAYWGHRFRHRSAITGTACLFSLIFSGRIELFDKLRPGAILERCENLVCGGERLCKVRAGWPCCSGYRRSSRRICWS